MKRASAVVPLLVVVSIVASDAVSQRRTTGHRSPPSPREPLAVARNVLIDVPSRPLEEVATKVIPVAPLIRLGEKANYTVTLKRPRRPPTDPITYSVVVYRRMLPASADCSATKCWSPILYFNREDPPGDRKQVLKQFAGDLLFIAWKWRGTARPVPGDFEVLSYQRIGSYHSFRFGSLLELKVDKTGK